MLPDDDDEEPVQEHVLMRVERMDGLRVDRICRSGSCPRRVSHEHPAALWLGLLLLVGNAFFVGAEFALVSASRTKVEPKAAAGSRVARTTLHAMEKFSLMIAAASSASPSAPSGSGAVAEPALAHLIEPVAHAVGLPDAWLHPVAFTLALTCVVYLHVVLGDGAEEPRARRPGAGRVRCSAPPWSRW